MNDINLTSAESLTRRSPAWLGNAAVLGALVSATITFLVLAGLTPIVATHEIVVALLTADALFALILLGIVLFEVVSLIKARRRGATASKLHTRLVRLFAVTAGLPAILVAIVAYVTLERGLDLWFSSRTRAIVDNSMSVARAYVNEHARVIRAETIATANDYNRYKAELKNLETLKRFLGAQAGLRGLPVMIVLKEDGSILERADLPFSITSPLPSAKDLTEAQQEEPLILAPGEPNIIGSIIRLKDDQVRFLFVARPVDPKVLSYVRATEASVAEYKTLDERRFGVQVAFAFMYILIALIVLLSAIWVALGFANQLVTPLRRLMAAAGQVSQGNLYVQVPVREDEGDLAGLNQTFNAMTVELRGQRDSLLDLNATIDERRRFIEAVVSGVSAGIISLDSDNKVSLANTMADQLLLPNGKKLVGQAFDTILPEAMSLIEDVRSQKTTSIRSGEIAFQRGISTLTLSLRVTCEDSSAEQIIVTIDDLTALVSAQRTAAWGDVARRIAHEIKNPLTPIQLSAERLKRKYEKEITSDKTVFHSCISTIIRQVEDIKRMVDEFSAFARMPKPNFETVDLVGVVKEAMFLLKVGFTDVEFYENLPSIKLEVQADRRLITQVLTNVVKNAAEAMSTISAENARTIEVRVHADKNFAFIDVTDSGPGWPKENREKLLEPYVTSREKGTGLGLAIVKRVVEEHDGFISLMDVEQGVGACLRIALPIGVITPSQSEDIA